MAEQREVTLSYEAVGMGGEPVVREIVLRPTRPAEHAMLNVLDHCESEASWFEGQGGEIDNAEEIGEQMIALRSELIQTAIAKGLFNPVCPYSGKDWIDMSKALKEGRVMYAPHVAPAFPYAILSDQYLCSFNQVARGGVWFVNREGMKCLDSAVALQTAMNIDLRVMTREEWANLKVNSPAQRSMPRMKG